MRNLTRAWNIFPLASGGSLGSPPHPKSEKLFEKTGGIFQWYILLEKRQKSKKYLVENYEKSQFSIGVFIKKSENFLTFSKFSLLLDQTHKTLKVGFLEFLCPVENYSTKVDYPEFFSQLPSIISTIFKNFHHISKGPSRSQPFLRFFDKFPNLIIECIGYFSGFIGLLHKNGKIKIFNIIFQKIKNFW